MANNNIQDKGRRDFIKKWLYAVSIGGAAVVFSKLKLIGAYDSKETGSSGLLLEDAQGCAKERQGVARPRRPV